MSNPVTRNQNAAVGGGTGIGGGLIVVTALGWAGVDLSAEAGVVIAGAIAAAALYVGRKGIRGVFRTVWRGNEG